jgi:hypothetical protein
MINLMNIWAILTLSLIMSGSQTALANDEVVPPGTELVVVSGEEVYVPDGFDDNDDVVVVIDGYLPDSCHKIINAEVDTGERGAIQINQFARKFEGICLPMRVPFFKEVNLGILPYGSYEINSPHTPTESLAVAEAANVGPDDFIYAPVDSVAVTFEENRYFAVLQGRYSNTCMGLDEVRLVDSGKTKALLPIIEVEGDECEETEVAFREKVPLPRDMPARRYLLHVRSLNGKSLNVMFSVTH